MPGEALELVSGPHNISEMVTEPVLVSPNTRRFQGGAAALPASSGEIRNTAISFTS